MDTDKVYELDSLSMQGVKSYKRRKIYLIDVNS